MPEDVGGTPFPDGWEPDDDHDRGVSDEEFASVVFDEAFVKAAVVHEPTAVERLLAAAEARAEASEAEARRARARGDHYDDAYGSDGPGDFGHDPDLDELDDADLPEAWERRYGASGAYGRQVRWHRPVAWMLALVMGVGMVALAFAAVYRGASSSSRDQLPSPATTGLEQGSVPPPSASTHYSRPPVSAVPRTP
ncbi:SCO2584 family spore wall biosynthesis protein [Streptomyces zaehneri]